MRYMVKELRYSTVKKPFVGKYDPYEHQWKTLELVRQAIAENKTICLINSSVTGSGKTLANFAAASLDGVPTIGVYPTNELLFDQHSSLVNSACLPSESLAILDSEGLELIQRRLLHIKSHAQALELATDDSNHLPVLLTNPDVLYLAMYNLYGQMFSDFARNFGARVFQNVLNNYPIIAFDEFHLYNVPHCQYKNRAGLRWNRLNIILSVANE